MTLTRHFKESAILPPQKVLDFVHEVEPAVVVILPLSLVNGVLEKYQKNVLGFDHNTTDQLVRPRPANKQETLQTVIIQALWATLEKEEK